MISSANYHGGMRPLLAINVVRQKLLWPVVQRALLHGWHIRLDADFRLTEDSDLVIFGSVARLRTQHIV
jgi:hypothetical protein